MNTNPTSNPTNEFHLPTRAELGYIAAAALMPYLLASILLVL